MEELKLSKKYSIYKSKYNNEYPISDFLKLVEFNHLNTIQTNNNSAWIEIESPIFDSINNQVKESIEKISHRKFTNWAQHHWVYTQRKGFDMEWMQPTYTSSPTR